MYSISRPDLESKAAFREAVLTIRDLEKRTQFKQSEFELLAKCRLYDQLGELTTFETASSASFHTEYLQPIAMVDLYDKQFRRGTRTKSMRDSLTLGAENGLCPYCGIGSVSQLDHYLPKSKYSAVTVHPQNLVPACSDCNKAKGAYSPEGGAAVLHPYFDSVFDTSWLKASLHHNESGIPAAEFHVESSIDSQLKSRLTTHLDVFSLRQRFSSVASQELQDFERMYKSPNSTRNLKAAREHLANNIEMYSTMSPNRWQIATYNAMLQSDWYLPSHLKLN